MSIKNLVVAGMAAVALMATGVMAQGLPSASPAVSKASDALTVTMMYKGGIAEMVVTPVAGLVDKKKLVEDATGVRIGNISVKCTYTNWDVTLAFLNAGVLSRSTGVYPTPSKPILEDCTLDPLNAVACKAANDLLESDYDDSLAIAGKPMPGEALQVKVGPATTPSDAKLKGLFGVFPTTIPTVTTTGRETDYDDADRTLLSNIPLPTIGPTPISLAALYGAVTPLTGTKFRGKTHSTITTTGFPGSIGDANGETTETMDFYVYVGLDVGTQSAATKVVLDINDDGEYSETIMVSLYANY